MSVLYRLLLSLIFFFLNPGFGIALPGFTVVPDGNDPMLPVHKEVPGILGGHYSALASDGILYVNKAAPGNNDGSSWANAFPELSDALLAAKTLNAATAGTVQQIWVAKGTYVPLYHADDNISGNGGRNNAFVLLTDVHLYGGGPGR